MDKLEEWGFVSRTARPGDILVACFWRRQTDDIVPPIESPPGWTLAGIQVHSLEGVPDAE